MDSHSTAAVVRLSCPSGGVLYVDPYVLRSFPDVNLCTSDGRILRCNRTVLAASFPAAREALLRLPDAAGAANPGDVDTFILDGVDSRSLRTLLEFAASGVVPANMGDEVKACFAAMGVNLDNLDMTRVDPAMDDSCEDDDEDGTDNETLAKPQEPDCLTEDDSVVAEVNVANEEKGEDGTTEKTSPKAEEPVEQVKEESVKSAKKFQCSLCVFGTDKEDTFTQHMGRHEANSCDGSPKYFCKLCGEGFARYEQVSNIVVVVECLITKSMEF